MTEAASLTLCDRIAATSFGIMETVLADLQVEGGASELLQGGDPLQWLPAAARGDRDAQAKLALLCTVAVYDQPETDHTVILAEAIMLARLAAEQGGRDDKFRCAAILAMGASFSWNPEARAEWAAEAVARLELLADAGDEPSERLLGAFAGTESPEVLKAAASMRDRLRAIEGLG